MIGENPYHKVGGRPPLTKIKNQILEIIQEQVETERQANLPIMMYRPADILEMYKKKYHDAPDLKTMKKYLTALCDDGKLKAKIVHDNKNTNSKHRRIRHVYEYNIEH